MILFTVAVVLLILLTGLAVITGAECEAEVKAALGWLGRRMMPPSGEHAAGTDDLLREVAPSAEGGPDPRLEAAGREGAVPVDAGTGTAPDYAVAHANAMYEASVPYLPEPPEMIGGFPVTYHEPLSVRADRPVTPVRGGHAPWTGAQPVLDDAALDQLDRVRWVRSQLPERAEDVTREDMERAIELLRELPPAPVYQQEPVARVLEAERLAQVMTP